MKWLLSIVGVGLVVAVLGLLGLGARDGRGRVTGAVELDHPAAAVFPLLVQPALRKQWLLGVQEISPVGDPTLRSGAHSRVTLSVPEEVEVDEEIRVVETDKRVLLNRTSSHPRFDQRLEYVLKDLGNGRTLVTTAVFTTYHGAVMNLLEPLLTRAAQTRMDQEIDQLRTAVGSAQAQAAAAATAALPVVSTPTVAVAPPTTAGPPPESPPNPVVPAGATAPPPAPEPTPTTAPQPTTPPPAAKPPEPPPAEAPPADAPAPPPPVEAPATEPRSDPANGP